PACGFVVHIELKNRRSWAQWSALGRSWKGEAAIVGNNYQNWDYYDFDNTNSYLTGFGCLTGTINLQHIPPNLFYGLQVGVAATAKNELPGISAWFTYSGTLNGKSQNGQGDINAEGGCGSGIEAPHPNTPIMS